MNSEDENDVEPKEIDSLLKTALTFSPDYDVNSYDPSTSLPCSGDDYLKYVMYETSKCQAIVTANLDESKLNKKTHQYRINCNDDSKECLSKTPKHLLPSLEWQNDQIQLFTKLRDRLEQLRQKCNGEVQESQNHHLVNVEWEFTQCSEKLPSLLEAVYIRQPKVISFLRNLIGVVEKLPNGSSIPRDIGVWLYSALALIQVPFLPNTCSTLRQLARKCIQLRAELTLEQQQIIGNVEPLNLFICLVTRYFNQIDLADKNL